MTSSKGRTDLAGPATPSQPNQEEHLECCMCGDLGLSSELFRCKICQFRSQHRYCSNIYPKVESNSVCNWCLNQKEDHTVLEKAQNSFNSSSSNIINTTSTSDQDDVMIKTKQKKNHIGSNVNNLQGSNMKSSVDQKGCLKVNVNKYHSIKKKEKSSSSPERSPLLAARKRITTTTTAIMQEESLRRTKSDIPKSVIIKKHVFRNKVRRYKLLDEVSS